MTENKNVFGILGHPLGHTLSPQIHTRLFEISGEQAEYKILDTPPEKLTDSFEYFKSLLTDSFDSHHSAHAAAAEQQYFVCKGHTH